VGVADTKQTKTIGEHHVASELARRGWAPALTRDGLERTDILAVSTEGQRRRMIEVQVKTSRRANWKTMNWLVGAKAFIPSLHEREYFVLVGVLDDLSQAARSFVLPRAHLAAAAWIQHMDWLTDPSVEPGKRNTPIGLARVSMATLAGYEDRWDLLDLDEPVSPVLLPEHFRELAQQTRVGLPEGHPWRAELPPW